jgi:hydroxyacylglutathione hydrolase
MRIINVNGVSYDSNAYFIDAGRKTLVDAGMDGQRVLSKLPGGLDLIVLTHCHFDHIGAVPEIVKATGAKVAMHEKDVPLITNARATAALMFNAQQPAIKIDIVLKDGDVIDLEDASLTVIHTPGHTPGCICLYDPVSKALFTGDTVFEGGSFGRTDIGGDEEQMISSLERLTKVDATALYPGHGGTVTKKVKESLLASYDNARHMLL